MMLIGQEIVINVWMNATTIGRPLTAVVLQKLSRPSRLALAAATPAALGEKYYGQCIACHGGRGEGGIGPQLAGQATTDIVTKLTAYRAGEERGAQSAMMYPVAKPMTDQDINNIAAYVSDL